MNWLRNLFSKTDKSQERDDIVTVIKKDTDGSTEEIKSYPYLMAVLGPKIPPIVEKVMEAARNQNLTAKVMSDMTGCITLLNTILLPNYEGNDTHGTRAGFFHIRADLLMLKAQVNCDKSLLAKARQDYSMALSIGSLATADQEKCKRGITNVDSLANEM